MSSSCWLSQYIASTRSMSAATQAARGCALDLSIVSVSGFAPYAWSVAAASAPASKSRAVICGVGGNDLATDLNPVGGGVVQQRGAVAVGRSTTDEIRGVRQEAIQLLDLAEHDRINGELKHRIALAHGARPRHESAVAGDTPGARLAVAATLLTKCVARAQALGVPAASRL
jgi:hypothetical protein